MRSAVPEIGPDPTVEEALRFGGYGELLPRASTDREANRLKKLRHCARQLEKVYGRVRLLSISEGKMQGERLRFDDRAQVGRDVSSACFTLLRKLARHAQAGIGLELLQPTVPQRRRAPAGPPPSRREACWDDLEILIARARPRVRAALALQAHIGATPTRVLSLRVRDIQFGSGIALVSVPGHGGGAARVPYAIPPDAMKAITPWLRRRARHGPDAFLFPMRGDSSRPTRSINRAIRREERLLGNRAPTMQEVRRLTQAGLRDIYATRAQVRGSARRRKTGRYRLTRKRLERQRERWLFQLGAADRPVTLRAPRRCASDEPELVRSQTARCVRDVILATPVRRIRGPAIPPTSAKPTAQRATQQLPDVDWGRLEPVHALHRLPPVMVAPPPVPEDTRRRREEIQQLRTALLTSFGVGLVMPSLLRSVGARLGEVVQAGVDQATDE